MSNKPVKISQSELDAVFATEKKPKSTKDKLNDFPKTISIVAARGHWTQMELDAFLSGKETTLETKKDEVVDVVANGIPIAKATLSQKKGHKTVTLIKA